MVSSPRRARMLLVGGAPLRRTECATLWHEFWCELVASRFGQLVTQASEPFETADPVELNRDEVDVFVELASGFDVVWCETPEALILRHEYRRRGWRSPGIV